MGHGAEPKWNMIAAVSALFLSIGFEVYKNGLWFIHSKYCEKLSTWVGIKLSDSFSIYVICFSLILLLYKFISGI